MNLRPEVERRKSDPIAIAAPLAFFSLVFGAIGATSVSYLWPREPIGASKRVGLSTCAVGEHLAVTADGTWACEPAEDERCGKGLTCLDAEIGDITSVNAKAPLTSAPSFDSWQFSPAWWASRSYLNNPDGTFREMKIKDGKAPALAGNAVDGWVSLAPDPATQCRHTVRDGKGKIVGTYLGECGEFTGDLTIWGFEPVAP